MATVRVTQAPVSEVAVGGKSVVVSYNNTMGGYIYNPSNAQEQGIPSAESLFISLNGAALTFAGLETFEIYPGSGYYIPLNLGSDIWVNAVTSAHKFSAYLIFSAVAPVFTSIATTFPPAALTTQTLIRGSYLYQEYSDDNDLQNFVNSYNTIAQNYLDTVNGLNLPIYTADNISGPLLDWVAQGIYGIARPVLASGRNTYLGDMNTYDLNTVGMNDLVTVGPVSITATSDDAFKRILTWALYRGDGRQFGIRWLKRRIMRFLLGTNGIDPGINETNQISVTFGTNYEVAIRFVDYEATLLNSALFNTFEMNTTMPNEINTDVIPLIPLPNRQLFYLAVLNNAIELPFQFTWTVII